MIPQHPLRTLRHACGLSLREAAQMSGVAAGTIGDLESGRNLNPRICTAVALAETYRVTLDDIVRLFVDRMVE